MTGAPHTDASPLRLFVAVETPPHITSQLKEIVERLRLAGADVKWEGEQKLHCTVKFLGDTPARRVEALSNSLDEITLSSPPLSLAYRTLGCFPGRREPRIIWAGIADLDQVLGDLFRRVDEAMSGFGFEREKRAFHPHVTLGRVRSQRGIQELITRLETLTFESQPVVIHHIALIKSDLRPSGSVYAVVRRFELRGTFLRAVEKSITK